MGGRDRLAVKVMAALDIRYVHALRLLREGKVLFDAQGNIVTKESGDK